MEDLEALLASSEFAAVKAAADALDPLLMLDDRVAPHLRAFRTGMTALCGVDFSQPEEPEETEPDTDEPGEPDGEAAP